MSDRGDSTYVGVACDLAELLLRVTYFYFRTARANHYAAVGAINMQSTAIHCEVQYSNRFDKTTAT